MPVLIPFIYILTLIKALTISSEAAQEDVFYDRIFDSRIKTVQLYNKQWNLSYPVLVLGSSDKLALHFDLLSYSPDDLYYSFVHCDKDWKESSIFPNDYIEGFEENPADDFKSSFNTKTGYYHYKVEFPNDRIRFRLSGNYIIRIHKSGNPQEVLLTSRFMITENTAGIEASAHRPKMTVSNNSGQQIDLTVRLGSLRVNDPYNDIYAFILQNGRWNNARKNLKPDFYGNIELKYNALSDKNIFPGGNEYRYFDIRSIRYQSEYVKAIDYSAPWYNILLFPSENREYKPYFYNKDFNGKYYIAVQEGRDFDYDADYVRVNFTLPARQKISGGNVYIYGALSNWQTGDDNLMVYNPRTEAYECTLTLKQGWYNYEYLFVRRGEDAPFPSFFEGNNYETENDYLVLVYYRNPRERYDRLSGSLVVNTLNRMKD